MLFDNSTKETSIANWIVEQTQQSGKFDCTSGYFTVGILAYLSKHLNEKITHFRFVLGDIHEVKNWYARRYLVLATAQRANLER